MTSATTWTILAAAYGGPESLSFAATAGICVGLPLVAVIYLEIAESAKKKRAEREAAQARRPLPRTRRPGQR